MKKWVGMRAIFSPTKLMALELIQALMRVAIQSINVVHFPGSPRRPKDLLVMTVVSVKDLLVMMVVSVKGLLVMMVVGVKGLGNDGAVRMSSSQMRGIHNTSQDMDSRLRRNDIKGVPRRQCFAVLL